VNSHVLIRLQYVSTMGSMTYPPLKSTTVLHLDQSIYIVLLSKLDDTRHDVMTPVLYTMVSSVHDLNADVMQSIVRVPSTIMMLRYMELNSAFEGDLIPKGVSIVRRDRRS
jgi:hypothetical protein